MGVCAAISALRGQDEQDAAERAENEVVSQRLAMTEAVARSQQRRQQQQLQPQHDANGGPPPASAALRQRQRGPSSSAVTDSDRGDDGSDGDNNDDDDGVAVPRVGAFGRAGVCYRLVSSCTIA